jgi:Telomere resolvase
VALDARAEAIQTFRDRIRQGDRTRLSQDDLEAMIRGFVEVLRGIRAKTRIRALCEAEIKLLEEGYPQASVAKYISRYRKAIKAAIEDGSLSMTKASSHRYIHRQRVTGVLEERHEHWALTYLKYSNEVYERLDKRQQVVKMVEARTTADTSRVEEEPIPVDLELSLEAAAVLVAKAIQAEDSRDEDDRAIARRVRQLKDDWQTDMNERMGRLRAEFMAQLQGAKQGYSMGWFVRRIETLEQENLTLRLEQDKAIAAGGALGHNDTAEVDRLKAENRAIAQALATAQDKLTAFRRLLNGDTEQGQEIAEDAAKGEAIQQHLQAEQESTVRPQPQDAEDIPRRAGTTRGTTTGSARGPKAGKAFKRAEAIVLAIKDWNRLHPTESFAINAGVMENIFRVHRQAVKEFFEAYQSELSVYHQELGVDSPRWHNRGKDTGALKRFVEDWVGKVGANSGDGAIA